MPDEKKPEFTVTDKRKFTMEGDRTETADEEKPSAPPEKAPAADAAQRGEREERSELPPPPTQAERQASSDAYAESRKQFAPSAMSGRSPEEYEMTFEKLVSSLYMSGAMALGGMQDEGGKTMVDIMGARQTIDSLAILAEKTKGNLTAAEENLLQSCLFDLRMAYVQITNMIAKQAQETPPEKK